MPIRARRIFVADSDTDIREGNKHSSNDTSADLSKSDLSSMN